MMKQSAAWCRYSKICLRLTLTLCQHCRYSLSLVVVTKLIKRLFSAVNDEVFAIQKIDVAVILLCGVRRIGIHVGRGWGFFSAT